MRTECFAMKNNKCQALTKTNCAGCNFYKTKEQQRKDLNKSALRLEKIGRII